MKNGNFKGVDTKFLFIKNIYKNADLKVYFLSEKYLWKSVCTGVIGINITTKLIWFRINVQSKYWNTF